MGDPGSYILLFISAALLLNGVRFFINKWVEKKVDQQIVGMRARGLIPDDSPPSKSSTREEFYRGFYDCMLALRSKQDFTFQAEAENEDYVQGAAEAAETVVTVLSFHGVAKDTRTREIDIDKPVRRRLRMPERT